MLILVCGLPCTGKSTVAKIIGEKLNGIVLRTDIIRKELFEQTAKRLDELKDYLLYDIESLFRFKPTKPKWQRLIWIQKELVYRTTLIVAKYLLLAKNTVILDGTFYKNSLRKMARDLAIETKNKFIIVECICPEDEVRKRIKRRIKGISDSNAAFFAYKKIKEVYEEIEGDHIIINTNKSKEDTKAEVLKKLNL